MTLGERLRQLRGSRTQDEMARIAGISRPTYIRLESGALAFSFEILIRLSQRLDISVQTLLAPVVFSEVVNDVLPFDDQG